MNKMIHQFVTWVVFIWVVRVFRLIWGIKHFFPGEVDSQLCVATKRKERYQKVETIQQLNASALNYLVHRLFSYLEMVSHQYR